MRFCSSTTHRDNDNTTPRQVTAPRPLATTIPRALAVFIFLLASSVACGDDSSSNEEDTIPEELALPGDAFYPESITVDTDGSLYVGSLVGGQIVRFASGATTSEVFVSGDDFAGATGVFATDGQLYVCAVDIEQLLQGQVPTTEVRVYSTSSPGEPAVQTLAIDGPSFCNDFAQDNAGNIYVADSLGRILVLPQGADTLEVWSSDPLLTSSDPAGFGADGISFDGQGALYVNTFTDGRLLRISIGDGGEAESVEEVNVSPALTLPDGMRQLDPETLVLVQGSGQVVKVSISGNSATSEVLRDGLNMPTSLAVQEDAFWITEGQAGILFGLAQGPPSLPFRMVSEPR
ncbi:MAG: hypothetical protein AAFS10_12235 [Myxococcota bacterium]